MFTKRKENIIVTIIILIVVLISIFIIYNVINLLKYKEGNPKDILYTSDIKASSNYNIYLKDNDFILDEYLPSKTSYISSLVEYINVNFNYENKSDINTNLLYLYNIKANVICEYIEEENNEVKNPIWNKEFILLEDTKKEAKDSNFKINTSANIGLNYYNNLVDTFRSTLNIPIRARLEIKFNVKIKGTSNENTFFDKNHYMTLTIPLNVKAFDIKEYKNFSDNETVYSNKPKTSEKIYMLAIINISAFILIILGAWYLIRIIKNKDRNKYYDEIRKILKTYDDRIVTVSNFVKFEKLEIVDLPDFDELLKLSNETLEPIIYWKRRSIKRIEAWFSILRNKILYRYIILYDPRSNIKNDKENI